MKVWKKLQVVFLALLLCTGMMTQPALAASLLQDGIEAALTTDKETYQQGEEIKVTLTVTNTNDTAVTNLSLENVLPENFVLAENTETTKKMESLQAGETVTLTTVCTVKASDDKKDDENKENPSGDDKKNQTDNDLGSELNESARMRDERESKAVYDVMLSRKVDRTIEHSVEV